MSAADDLAGVRARIQTFSKASPGLFAGFAAVSKVATSPGTTFDAASRELIATAIAVSQGCEDCILYHVAGAKRHGATEQGLVEALEVAVEMGGGPAVMYAAKALEAFRAL
jgi:AhpD family alkylhydroperoxidase